MLSLLLFSCHPEGNEPNLFDPSVEVICVYTPRGIGDNSTAGMIYTGVLRTTDSLGIACRFIFPITFEEGADSIAQLVRENQKGRKRLIISTDPEYSHYLQPIADARHIIDSDSTKLLVLDGAFAHPDVYTAYLSHYGVMYMAGYMAGKMADVDSVHIYMANTVYQYLREGRDGFIDGFTKERDNTIDVFDIGTWGGDIVGGFLHRDMAYMMFAPNCKDRYDMVVPLCGETAMGFLRYSRDFPGCFYTMGIGLDMSIYSQDVPFSSIEYTDRMVSKCIIDWMNNSLSHYRRFGMDEGWVELMLSAAYQKQLEPWVEAIYNEAVEMEVKYAN